MHLTLSIDARDDKEYNKLEINNITLNKMLQLFFEMQRTSSLNKLLTEWTYSYWVMQHTVMQWLYFTTRNLETV